MVTSRRAIGHGAAETLQDAFNQDRVSRLPMKEEENKDDIVIATQYSQIAVQDERKATD